MKMINTIIDYLNRYIKQNTESKGFLVAREYSKPSIIKVYSTYIVEVYYILDRNKDLVLDLHSPVRSDDNSLEEARTNNIYHILEFFKSKRFDEIINGIK